MSASWLCQVGRLTLELPGDGSSFKEASDFSGDSPPDVALLTQAKPQATVAVFYNSGKADSPLDEETTGR